MIEGLFANSFGHLAAADPGRGKDPNAVDRAERAEARVRVVQHDIERLLMITEALWSMLKEQHGYADEELFRRVSEIDLRDGRADGCVAPSPPKACPYCGRHTAKTRPICIYCGKAMMVDLFAR